MTEKYTTDTFIEDIIPIKELGRVREREDASAMHEIISNINMYIREAIRYRKSEVEYSFHKYPHLIDKVSQRYEDAGYLVEEFVKKDPFDFKDENVIHYLKISGWHFII